MTHLDQPDLLNDTPNPVEPLLLEDLNHLLQKRFQEHLKPGEIIAAHALSGPKAAWLLLKLGDEKAAQVFEFFVRAPLGYEFELIFGLLVDFADGVLQEFFAGDRDAWLPLDFSPHVFEGETILARQEFHRFDAEGLADELLKKSEQK